MLTLAGMGLPFQTKPEKQMTNLNNDVRELTNEVLELTTEQLDGVSGGMVHLPEPIPFPWPWLVGTTLTRAS